MRTNKHTRQSCGLLVEAAAFGDVTTVGNIVADCMGAKASEAVRQITEEVGSAMLGPLTECDECRDDDCEDDEYDDEDDEDSELDEVAPKRKILFRMGKRLVKKKCPRGYRIKNGKCVKIVGGLKIKLSRAAKKGAKKRKAKKAQANRNRARTNRKRKAAGL